MMQQMSLFPARRERADLLVRWSHINRAACVSTRRWKVWRWTRAAARDPSIRHFRETQAQSNDAMGWGEE